MLTRAEILEKWPTLSPRERDALVAEALGWRVRRRETEDLILLWCTPPGFEDAIEIDISKRSTAVGQIVPLSVLGGLPRYSSSWADAGPLLEVLRIMDGQYVKLCVRKDGWWLECRDVEAYAAAAPEAIALAYILAKAEN